MKTLIQFFRRVADLFRSGKVQATLDKAATIAIDALPYIDLAAQIVAGITPTTIDNVALAAVHAKFPKLFDSTLTTDEKKLYMLGVAAELLKSRFPGISTSIARSAVQAVYTGAKAA